MFNQTFDPEDLGTVGLLVLLEGVLSIDNALILGVMAARVPRQLANKALAYGLGGALVFRLLAVALAAYLLRFSALKPIGALFLIYLVIRRFFFKSSRPRRQSDGAASQASPAAFWKSVLAIELTDVSFAVDNVLAAVALVGPPPRSSPPGSLHPKLWVIFTGGMLGVILTRFAAAVCIGLIRRFPRLDACAYWLVLLVACKLGLEWLGVDFQATGRPAFWIFWCALILTLLAGFVPGRADGAARV